MRKFIIIFIVVLIFLLFSVFIYKINNPWKIKKINQSSLISDSIAIEKKWEDKIISEKYDECNYDDITYTSTNTTISSQQIETQIDEVILIGEDKINKVNYNVNGILYSVKNYSKECVVAIKFEGDTNYYLYNNLNYIPSTLGDFIDDLNLKNTTVFNSIWYNYAKTNSDVETIEFPEVPDEIIWDKILDNISIKNTPLSAEYIFNTILTIDCEIQEFGYTDLKIYLSDEGYLRTELFYTRNDFYIGKEKVEEFLDYIINNYEGFKIIYVDDEDSNNEKILKYDKATNTTTVIEKNEKMDESISSNEYSPN